MCGYSPYPIIADDIRLPHIAQKIHQQIAKTALGAELTAHITVCSTIEDAIEQARADGYTCIAALEQASNSIAIESFPFTQATAMVIGNEVDGVDAWTKSATDVILEITQYGSKESLNVASATAVALYAARYQSKNYA